MRIGPIEGNTALGLADRIERFAVGVETKALRKLLFEAAGELKALKMGRCQQCGVIFEVNHARRKFCSPACRIKFCRLNGQGVIEA